MRSFQPEDKLSRDPGDALHGTRPGDGPDEHRCGGLLWAEGNRAKHLGEIGDSVDLFGPRATRWSRNIKLRPRPAPRIWKDFWRRWNGKACCVWNDLKRAARISGHPETASGGGADRSADCAGGDGVAAVSAHCRLAGNAGRREPGHGDGRGNPHGARGRLGSGRCSAAGAVGWALPCPGAGCHGDAAPPRPGGNRSFGAWQGESAGFDAHAWLRLGSCMVTGGRGPRAFQGLHDLCPETAMSGIYGIYRYDGAPVARPVAGANESSHGLLRASWRQAARSRDRWGWGISCWRSTRKMPLRANPCGRSRSGG